MSPSISGQLPRMPPKISNLARRLRQHLPQSDQHGGDLCRSVKRLLTAVHSGEVSSIREASLAPLDQGREERSTARGSPPQRMLVDRRVEDWLMACAIPPQFDQRLD